MGSAPSTAERDANRRRHRRVEVAGIAVALEQNHHTVWTVQDLSLGGALLIGESLLLPQQNLPMTFHLPARPPLSLLAHVLRRQLASSRGRTAIAFDALTPDKRRALSEAIEAPAPAPAKRAAIVVGRTPAVLTELMSELGALGYEPRLASSPLEAAAWLQRETSTLAVLVDEKLIEERGWNLLQYMRDTRPQIRRLVIGSSAHGFRTDVTLRSGLADAIVERPFSLETLARRLGPTVEVPRKRAR